MHPTPLSLSGARPSALRRALADLIPAFLGLALLGLIGFAPYPAVHDAFHDVRHTAGFPCH